MSQQDVDVKTADAAEQKAQVAAAEQEVARYQALIAFKQLTAPFDGVVTSRRTNVGDYVNAAGGDATIRSASAPLFERGGHSRDADLRVRAAGVFRRPETGPDRNADAAAGPGQAYPGAGS